MVKYLSGKLSKHVSFSLSYLKAFLVLKILLDATKGRSSRHLCFLKAKKLTRFRGLEQSLVI